MTEPLVLDDCGVADTLVRASVPSATTGIKATDDGYFYINSRAFHADFAADLGLRGATER